MEIPDFLNHAISLGLVMLGLIVGWFVQAVAGGFKFGKFARTIEVPVERAHLASFLEQVNRRRAELGFSPTGIAGQYLQGGYQMQDAGAFTHAKTPKKLSITMDESIPSQPRVQFALEYVNSIVADSGEGSYRDAVLDYLAGQKDAMAVVPNRSYMAVCAFVGSIVSWLGVFVMWKLGLPFFQAAMTLGVTYVLVAILAIVSLLRKRGEAVGMPLAIGGAVLSLLLLAVVIGVKVSANG